MRVFWLKPLPKLLQIWQDCVINPHKRRHLSLTLYFTIQRQEKADFKGLRLHSFDTASHILRIESAVPEQMVTSIHAERFAIAIMQDAIDSAGKYFFEQHVLFDLFEYLALVDLLIPKEQRAIN